MSKKTRYWIIGLALAGLLFCGGFVGLGVAPLILNAPEAYIMLGITYLVIAAARVAGVVLDGSVERSNLISLGFEIVAGIILVL